MQAALQGSARNRLHHPVHDHVAGGGVHSHPVHERHCRPAAARIRRHHHRGDPDLRPGLGDPDADAVRPRAEGRAAREAQRASIAGAKTAFNCACRHAYDRSLHWALRHRRVILGVFCRQHRSPAMACSRSCRRISCPATIPASCAAASRPQTGTSFDQVVAYTRQVMKIVQADPNVADVQARRGRRHEHRAEAAVAAQALGRPGGQRTAPQAAQHSRHRRHLHQSAHHPHRRARLALHLSIHPAGPGSGRAAAGRPTSWSRRCRTIPTFVGVNSDQDKVAPVGAGRHRPRPRRRAGRHARRRSRARWGWPLAASRCRRSMPPPTSIR